MPLGQSHRRGAGRGYGRDGCVVVRRRVIIIIRVYCPLEGDALCQIVRTNSERCAVGGARDGACAWK